MTSTTQQQANHRNQLRMDAFTLPHSVPELLAQAVARYGDGEAISFFEAGTSLTFRQLGEQVHRLAASLHQIGVRRGSHVAVMLPNRIEFPLTWLALAELGAVMVPVITSLTSRELEFLLGDADVGYAVVDQRYLGVFDGVAAGARLAALCTVVVDAAAVPDLGTGTAGQHDFATLLAREPAGFAADAQPVGTDLLSIQYTSGTTGLPKGVMLSHRFWIEAGYGPIVFWELEGVRSILSDHPFYYIDPQWMLIAGLYTGARVDFTNGMSVSKFLGWMQTRRSELAWFPDPLLKSSPTAADGDNAMKLFMAYHCSVDMLAEAERRYGAPTREAYGMTEIAMGLAVPREILDPAMLGTCGVPGPWRECRIVDSDGNDVQAGCEGELLVRGAGICSGYYNRPDANRETFIDGWFRTGDLFVQNEQGYYRIVGRLKDMVKRSGENIAAIEVERALLEHPAIMDAAVVAVPDAHRDEEVKAYLVLREGFTDDEVTPQSVLAHCAARLAKFKLPRYLAYVTSLPYTPSEKVAKKKLVEAQADLRIGAYDAVDQLWR